MWGITGEAAGLSVPRRRELDMKTEIRGGRMVPDITSVLTLIAPPGGGGEDIPPPCCSPPRLAAFCCPGAAGVHLPEDVVTQKLWLFSSPSAAGASASDEGAIEAVDERRCMYSSM